MTEKTFIDGMNYLKATYISWKFDTNSEQQIRVWYSMFDAMDDKDFMDMIKQYAIKNKYPPQSPVELLEIKVGKLTELTPDEAWAKCIKAINKYSFDRLTYVDYLPNGEEITYTHRQRLYDSLREYPILQKTVEDYESILENWDGDSYLPVNFKKSYETNVHNREQRLLIEYHNVTDEEIEEWEKKQLENY